MTTQNQRDFNTILSGFGGFSGVFDALVRKLTAFRSSEELTRAMRDDGYVPTLRVDNVRSPSRRTEMLKLRAFVRIAGFQVFPETVPGEEG